MSGLILALRPGGAAAALAWALRGALGPPLGLAEPPTLLDLPAPPAGEALLARLALGGELPAPVLALGLAAAVAALPARGAVLLFAAEAEAQALFGATPPAAALLAIRAALRESPAVVALDAESLRFAAGFGAAAERIEAPPLAPPADPAPQRPAGALVIDHGVPPAQRQAALAAIAATGAVPHAVDPRQEDAFGPARLAAALHVHLGLPRATPLGWRPVDSLACRRPVVMLAPPAATGLAAGAEALVAEDTAGLAEAVARLAADFALAEALVQGGARAAEAALARSAAALAARLQAAGMVPG